METFKKPIRVGQYQMHAIIGRGNFAVVKLATHIPTGSMVAIKIIDKAQLCGFQLEQVKQEISVLKMFHHPHIIRLYQVMQTEKFLYLVMEYASGGEIYDYVKAHGRMDEEEARQRFKQILAALLHCQVANVVHRDLKLENLLLDRHRDVKIADFGFSMMCKPGAKLSSHCGSPSYAAPELFDEADYEGCRVDAWSLGIVLYIITVGSLPFSDDDLEKLCAKIKKRVLKIPFFLSPECEDLIKRLLCVDPQKRLSLREAASHKWLTMGRQDRHFEDLLRSSLEPPEHFRLPFFPNQHILTLMHKMSFREDDLLTSLRERKFDYNWATYHLMFEKFVEKNLQKHYKNHQKHDLQINSHLLDQYKDSGFKDERTSDEKRERLNINVSIVEPPPIQGALQEFASPEAMARYLSMRRHSEDTNKGSKESFSHSKEQSSTSDEKILRIEKELDDKQKEMKMTNKVTNFFLAVPSHNLPNESKRDLKGTNEILSQNGAVENANCCRAPKQRNKVETVQKKVRRSSRTETKESLSPILRSLQTIHLVKRRVVTKEKKREESVKVEHTDKKEDFCDRVETWGNRAHQQEMIYTSF